MKPHTNYALLGLCLAAMSGTMSGQAATVWNGPLITYTQPAPDPTQAANQDRITPKVWLTRASTAGLFNAKTESFYTKPTSPADTEWAVGALADATTLTYTTWQGVGDGFPVLNLVGKQLVLHLMSEDIYLSVQFTALGGHTLGGFSYIRSTPAGANMAPSVTITNPPDNSSFASPGAVTIEAEGADTDGSVTNVEFFDGAVSLGSDATSPYSISASLAPGSHTLTAVASDNLGATTTSGPIHVTVAANEAPTVAITYPPDGAAMFSPATVTVTADAADPGGSVASVQFFDGATSLGTDTTSPYSVTVNFNPGVHPLTAVATDNLGLSTTSAVVSLTVTAANQPPSVTITNPPDNSVFGNTDRLTIGASASDADGNVTNVQFFDGAVLLRSVSASPYSFTTAPFTFALGLHTLTAVVSDNLGATATSAPVHLTVARYLPAITNGNIAIHLQPVATGMAAPDYAISPPGDTSRLFVVEQNGLLRIIQDGTLLPGAALDIQGRVQPPLNASNPNDERGFLGLAFHPGFTNPASPGYRTLYTYNSELIPAGTTPTYPVPTTATNNYKNVVNEWKISATDANVVDPASRREVISFGKTAGNHNGGTIAFGPDGYLYLALGDGGDANDVGASHIEPGGNAQNLSTPLGKFLRFDPLNPALTPGSSDPISANSQYRIPTTNPFQAAGQVPEIYAYGLRNPYRFCFDRVTGELIHADVGQNNIEEIDRIVLGGNYGWAIKEGDFLFNRTNGPSGPAGTIGAPPGNRSPGIPAGLTDPISGPMGTLEYDHNEGISITGGFVYRGSAIPELYGKYVFGDLALKTQPVRADGRIFYADLQAGTINAFPLAQFGGSAILPNGLTVHGFGQDAEGELYALVTSTPANGTGGIVYKLVAVSAGVNMAPSVTITNPLDNSSFSTPSTVNIGAKANDADGSVANVEFFDGAASLGSDATSPYSVTVSFYPGVHPLTAIATDNLGLSTTSAVVSLTVTSTPIANPIVDRVAKGDITVELRTVADGMVSPLGMAVPDDGSGRMFVYDQAGLVWLVTAAGRSPTPVLDLRTRLVNISGGYDERGLLGLAVHTNFAQLPLLYTYTSENSSGSADFPSVLQLGGTNNHQSVIAEWLLSPSSTNVVDPSTRREILRIDKPQSNHNGGTMRFGPDGLLYVSLGDGGNADDEGNGHSVPGGNGQNTNTILGKIIRIDVDSRNSANGQYGVPSDNPFVGGPGIDEIFAYGLRNPFSFHFDRGTGQLWLGDVGQNKVEEIDIIEKGRNYGWNVKEGSFFFDPNGGGAGFVTAYPVRPVPPDVVDPVAQYDHDDGTAVIGGTVYRGSQLPALAGRYVFGDWGVFGSPSGRLFYLDASSNVKELRLGLNDRPLGLFLKGFGEDAAGELYVFTSKPQGPTGMGGAMMKLVPPPASAVAITGQGVANGTNFQTTWTGGSGPFAQQRKISLDEPVWMDESFTSGNSATARLRGPSGFFREVDTARQAALPLTVTLNGAMERPVTSTAGTGSGILSLAGNTLTFSISYQGLSGPATLAHIHGPTNSTGPTGVLIDLRPYNGGAFGSNGTLSGTLVLSDTHKAYLLAGQTYVNIHTAANPGGEIRGQIAPVLMQASLLGAYEPTPTKTAASGLGTFMLVGTQLTYTVSLRGLSGPASAGHIHGPAPLGQNAGVMIPFSVPNATAATVSGTVGLTPTQLAAIVDGQAYANFHTAAYPGGEIRGQIVAQSTAVPFTAWISGLNERPLGLTNTASGLGLFSLDGSMLSFNITYSGLSSAATAAHIHGATAASGVAGVQIDLAPFHAGAFGTNGAFSGVVPLSVAQRDMILNGQAYFNIHTAANPGGEARGQIATVLMSASADGAAERPTPWVTTGSALGLFALVGSQLDLNITYRTLSGTATGAHIHAPANASGTAAVVVNFQSFSGGYGASGSVSGTTNLWPALPAVLVNLIDGLGYINFHTAANPGGEIRGQIMR